MLTAAYAGKASAARRVTVTQSVPLREGARAPQILTNSNVPSTSGPVSVTKPKA
jgi:hypothetical protein